jgi:hypothetical protein
MRTIMAASRRKSSVHLVGLNGVTMP